MVWKLIVSLLILPSIAGWDVRSVKKNPAHKYQYLYKREVSEVDDWKIWPNATKNFTGETCASELAPYPELPEISTDSGSIYDVKTLNTFKHIGESFLRVVTRRSLFETVELAMKLSPIDSLDKILQIIEYQLIMFILVVTGVFVATTILIVYVIFWSMKLTGNVQEVECQTIADSQGSMRIILSFLLLIFTLFVIFGCTIAWVSNIHITNNVEEAEHQIEWTVNMTKNFTSDIDAQMVTLFTEQYKMVYLDMLSKRINESIHNASALVYLALAQNISDTYNKTLMITNSLIGKQMAALVALEAYYQDNNETLSLHTGQILAAQSCVDTLSKWCDSNSEQCDDKLKMQSNYLNTINPALLYVAEVYLAAADAVDIAENGSLAENADVGYLNGVYFHNGSLEDMSETFYSESPEYIGICKQTDWTTGALSTLQGDTSNTSMEYRNHTITCTDADGCMVTNTSTTLYVGECCVEIMYIVEPYGDDIDNLTDATMCGNQEVWENGVLSLTDGNQSDYRGNYSESLSGRNCFAWSNITYEPGTDWATAGYNILYDGLYYTLLENDHNYCRNPSTLAYLAKNSTEIRNRAWCFVNKTENGTEWEYCDVPSCINDTDRALDIADANGQTAYTYPTCNYLKSLIYSAAKADSSSFTLWQTTAIPREEVYFALSEAAAEMDSQYQVIRNTFADTNAEFDELQRSILGSISNGSEASKFDGYRNVATIGIVSFCMISACLAVVGVCMGYCNISEVAPHLRSSGCNMGGRLVKISSYWAAIMAIINLYMATLFFLPGAAFSLICIDFTDGNLFQLFDEQIIVNYSVLGRAVLENDSYDAMTLRKLWVECGDNRTLWVALGLDQDPDYDLADMLQLNETLNIEYTFEQLRAVKYNTFTDYPMYPPKLKQYLELWNASWGSQLPWGNMKSNLQNNFMGASLATLKSDKNDAETKFCELFAEFGGQVADDVTGTTLECRTAFTETTKDECDDWLKDYVKMNTLIDNLQALVTTIENEWSTYGNDFMLALLDEYTITNDNLLNVGNTFSQDIINKAYDYWQPVMENEIGCLSWKMNYSMENNFTMCYPVTKMINSTMDYFCGYMVTSMTLAWLSQGILGVILALHMLVANSLSVYFLKMERRHIEDIPKEDIIAAFE